MKEYLRKDLRQFEPYRSPDAAYTIKMDANESPYDLPMKVRQALAEALLSGSGLNLYPDSDADALRDQTAVYLGVERDNLVMGAGSDEMIQIIIQAFVHPGDTVLYPDPSFGMYKIFTQIAGGKPTPFPLDQNFDVPTDPLIHQLHAAQPKVLFLCSPNNPTGNAMPCIQVETVLQAFDGVVVVDEAYGEFAEASVLPLLSRYPHLIVLRTFSKALGMAGLRVGYSVSGEGLTRQLMKVKPPYNLNSFSQQAAGLVLDALDTIGPRIAQIREDRERLYSTLAPMPYLTVYPSQANFLLIRVNPPVDAGIEDPARDVYEALLAEGILTRPYFGHPRLGDCLRVTIGRPEENQALYQALFKIMKEMED